MIEVALMIEGQSGLNWPRWQRMAQAAEGLGFKGLYRSDHFTDPEPPDQDSLELWASLTWLASHTRRIEFGPLVSPVSFRHPTQTARTAAAVDDLSGGRLTLGLGAGWNEREHILYGWDLLDIPGRFTRFEEGLEVISRLLHSDQPVNFEGKYYQLRGAILLPRPQRRGGPPVLIGGNGIHLTLPLAARFAAEWNAVEVTPARFARLNAALDELLSKQGRAPGEVRRSAMLGCIFGRDPAEVQRKAAARSQGKQDAAQLRAEGMVVGTGSEMVEQLGRLAEVGMQRVMLQWMELDDLDSLETMAHQVLPQVQSA